MHLRNLVVAAALMLFAGGLVFCGGASKAGPDAGHPTLPDTGPAVACYSDYDCVQGNCVGGACVLCSLNSCTGGQACSPDFKCVGCDGGCFPADAGPKTCSLRAECAAGLVCHNQKCQAPDPTGKCDSSEECPAGQVCNWTANVCMVGCTSNTDCAGVVLDGGLPAPHCDTATTNQCTQCVDSNDCDQSKGQVCTATDDAGTSYLCKTAPTCVPPDNTPCKDHVCVAQDGGGFGCGPCTSADQCGAGYDCTGGKCVQKSTGCTSDSQCKTISPGQICDISSGQCEWGCLPDDPDAGAYCGVNCCNPDAGQDCNTATHQCEGGGQPCDDCSPPCNLGDTCDTSTCSCISGSDVDGGGLMPGTCDPTSCVGCDPSETCKCYGVYTCSPGAGCASIPGFAPFAMCQ